MQVLLPELKLLTSTTTEGKFELNDIPYGNYILVLQNHHDKADTILISVYQPLTDLGPILSDIILPAPESVTQDDGEEESGEDGAGIKNNISALLNSSGDVFHNTAVFNWGAYGFRQRGYTQDSRLVLVNGILMNDLVSGNPVWSLWSGLNDVFRNAVNTYGLALAEQSPGALNGMTSYEIGALFQVPQTRLSWALSDRAFDNRVMLSHSSGTGQKGWAWSAACSRRWATESYVPGTSLDAWSLFLALSKIQGSRQEWHLTAFAAYTDRSKAAAATDELYRLAGSVYYNSNWGWQNGKIRNARQHHSLQPVALLSHQYVPSRNLILKTATGLQTGLVRNTSLDWYKAADPRPDYYRNMPSFFAATDTVTSRKLEDILHADKNRLQIDWNRLYEINRNNRETLLNAAGISGNTVDGHRSAYVICSDAEQIIKYSFSSQLQYKPSALLQLYAGLSFIHQHSNYYRQLEDLLGGDYFLNYNQFAAQQFTGNNTYLQHDLNIPDRAIRKGDRYRYHYAAQLQEIRTWIQAECNTRKFSGFITFQLLQHSYTREGFYRNALFPEDSYGKSRTCRFTGYSSKAGITFKINGRNYLFAHGLYASEDQGFANIFIAPRMRNQAVDQPGMKQIQSMEAGYTMKAPKMDLLLQGYATSITNSSNIQRFYNDDPASQGFINFLLSDLSLHYSGIELGAAYRFSPAFACNAAASLGQAYYTSRPSVSIYAENDTVTQAGTANVYLKNYYLGAGPQSAYMTGITFTGNRYWFIRLACNYFERNYMAVNPARRSTEAAELVPENSPLYDQIFGQEVLPAFYTLDMNAGKSLRLRKWFRTAPGQLNLYLNLGISNLLNTKMKTGGYEQLRYDFSANNPDKFPSKYFYGYGRTFLLSISLRM